MPMRASIKAISVTAGVKRFRHVDRGGQRAFDHDGQSYRFRKKVHDTNPSSPIYVTGHLLGGAEAEQVAASRDSVTITSRC
jgi:hypothetical protein